jgi:serine/threonine protein kinase
MSDEILTNLESGTSSQIEYLGSGSYGVIVSEVGSDTCRKIFTKDRAMSLIREAFIVKKLSHIRGITEIIKLDYPTPQDHQFMKKNKILTESSILKRATSTETTKSEDETPWGVIVMRRYCLTLNQWLRTKPSYDSRFKILKEIIRIIKEIHNAGVIHADLKLENIMLTDTGEVRIIDWGLSSFKGYARIQGTTKTYRPRQLIQHYCHDIYSLGVIMIQLILGLLIVNTLEYLSCIRMLEAAISHLPLRKLLSRMIHPECKNRPTIHEITSFFNISTDISKSILDQNYVALNIPSSYGISNLKYPLIFQEFLLSYPETYETIICILGAIYQCVDPRKLLLRVNYTHVVQFINLL